MAQVIDFVKCPRCKKEYIQGDLELVCKDCAPAMQADLDLQSLLTSISALEDQVSELGPVVLKDRAKILNNLIHRLKKIHKEVLNDKSRRSEEHTEDNLSGMGKTLSESDDKGTVS